MTILASLSVKLIADAAPFQKGLGKAEGQVQQFVSGVGRSVQTVGKVALGGLGMVTTAAGAAGAALTKLAMDASEVEGVGLAFEGLAESAGTSADKLLAALEKGSAGMIAQRDLMKSYNTAAQLVSKDFASTLPDAMGYLSKVAASTGQDLDFLLESYVRGVGRLSPMILDNLAVQVDLMEAYDAYAVKIGKATDALTKQEQQMAVSEATLAKLAESTAAMPDVTETAAAKMARFKAMLRNVKDEAGKMLLPVLTDMLGTLAKIGEKVLPLVVNVLSWRLVPILEKSAAFVGVFVDAILAGRRPIEALAGALRAVGLDRVADWLARVRGAVGDLWAKVKPFVVQVLEWVGTHVKLADVLAALGVAISAVIIPAIGGLVASVAPVIAVFMGLVGLFTLVRTAWKKDWGGIKTFVLRAVRGIQRVVSRLIEMVKGGEFKTLFSSLDGGAILQRIGDGLKTGYEIVRGWVAEHIVVPIATFITETDWKAVGWLLLIKIGNALKTGYEIVRGWVLNHIVTPIATFITETDWSAVGQSIQTKIGEVVESVKGFASDKLGGLLESLTGEGSEAAPASGGVVGILDKITNFVNGPGGTALSVIGAIVGLVTGIGAPIAIVIGLVKLLSWAWKENFGGIRDITAKLVENFEGWFDSIGVWARATFKKALLALLPFIARLVKAWIWINAVAIPTLKRWGKAFMEGLQPHLEKMSATLAQFQEKIGPKVHAVWNKLNEAWKKISSTVMDKLWPAIKRLLDALGIDITDEDFFKGLGELAGFLLEVGLGVLLGTITFALDALALAIDACVLVIEGLVLNFTMWVEAITSVINAIDELSKMDIAQIFEKIAGVELPDWLKPGSPPPLYYALMDIGKAMDVVSSSRLPTFDMGLPGDTMSSVGRAVGAGASGVQGGGSSVVLYGPVHVEGVQDARGLIEELQDLANA